MEVFILKSNYIDIIVRLYREFIDLMIVEGEFIGVIKDKFELIVIYFYGCENGFSDFLLEGV